MPQIEVGWNDVQQRPLSFLDRLSQGVLAGYNLGQLSFDVGFGSKDIARRTLGVQIPEQSSLAGSRCLIGDIYCKSGFSNSALDVVKGDDLHLFTSFGSQWLTVSHEIERDRRTT